MRGDRSIEAGPKILSCSYSLSHSLSSHLPAAGRPRAWARRARARGKAAARPRRGRRRTEPMKHRRRRSHRSPTPPQPPLAAFPGAPRARRSRGASRRVTGSSRGPRSRPRRRSRERRRRERLSWFSFFLNCDFFSLPRSTPTFSNVQREKKKSLFRNDGVPLLSSRSTIANRSSWSSEESRRAQQVAHGCSSSREAAPSSKSVRRLSQPSTSSCLNLGISSLPRRRRRRLRHRRHRRRLPPSSSSFLFRAPPQPGHRPLGRPRRPPADHLLVPRRRLGQEEARRGGEGQGKRGGQGAGEAREAAEAAGRGVRETGSLVAERKAMVLPFAFYLSR